LERELERYYQVIVPELPADDIVYENDLDTGSRIGIRNLWRMERYSNYFDHFARGKEVLELVGMLVNGPPLLMLSSSLRNHPE